MTKTYQDFPIYKGNDVDIVVNTYNSDGSPLDVAGATITWVLRSEPGATPVLTKTVGSGIVIGTNSFTVTLTAAETAALTLSSYFHSATAVLSGKTKTLLTGNVTVLAP